jgi:hypothetical protein
VCTTRCVGPVALPLGLPLDRRQARAQGSGLKPLPGDKASHFPAAGQCTGVLAQLRIVLRHSVHTAAQVSSMRQVFATFHGAAFCTDGPTNVSACAIQESNRADSAQEYHTAPTRPAIGEQTDCGNVTSFCKSFQLSEHAHTRAQSQHLTPRQCSPGRVTDRRQCFNGCLALHQCGLGLAPAFQVAGVLQAQNGLFVCAENPLATQFWHIARQRDRFRQARQRFDVFGLPTKDHCQIAQQLAADEHPIRLMRERQALLKKLDRPRTVSTRVEHPST